MTTNCGRGPLRAGACAAPDGALRCRSKYEHAADLGWWALPAGGFLQPGGRAWGDGEPHTIIPRQNNLRVSERDTQEVILSAGLPRSDLRTRGEHERRSAPGCVVTPALLCCRATPLAARGTDPAGTAAATCRRPRAGAARQPTPGCALARPCFAGLRFRTDAPLWLRTRAHARATARPR